MQSVMIAGAGMTPFGRFLDTSVRELTAQAVDQAMADAGVTPEEIGFIAFGNAAGGLLNGQECVRGQVALRGSKLLGKPIVNVENACASSSTAAQVAWMAVLSGQCDVALAIGAEKMYHHDKSVPFRALEAAADRAELEALKQRIGSEGGGSVFMDVYAELTRGYMRETGATARDLAEVAAKTRANGALNPKSQFREQVSPEQVLASRPVKDPLTLLMCSPIGDGAAALVLMREDVARRKGIGGVKIRAMAVASGHGGGARPCAETAARRAYEMSGIGPGDLDVVELHDAAAPAELFITEQIGLAAPGGGVGLFRSGRTRLGGEVPVNPSGGLIAKGHPIGATGCAQLVELADQLRGRCGARQVDGARIALAENGGGWMGDDAATAVVTVLSV
jgi:acetyl-CoA acyltransferase